MAKRSKLNPRQEKFVREYVKTGNGTKAYAKAGYSASTKTQASGAGGPATNAASRLLASDSVKQAIVAHQLRTRTRHDYTVDTLLGELDEARDLARETKQPSAAVQATTVKARLLGMIVERKETGAPGEFAALDSVQAILAAATKELGQDAARALAALVNEPLTIDASAQDVSSTPHVVGDSRKR